ncbi:putative squalene-hopene-cyclase, partial [Talaromyces proteolyticus]
MPLQKRTEDLKLNANQSLARAINWSFDQQHSDGHWVAECHSNATITAQYIFLRQAFDIDHEEADSFKVWIFSQQKPDGSWGLATNYRGDVSTTTESYLALKILGVSGDEPRMVNARRFVLNHGGCEKVRFFTRFFLASFGLFPWNSVPQLPAEFILAPSWFPINIQSLSYWARATLIPMLCLRYHEPVYALPNGLSRDNNFLDELWCDPANKNVPYAPSLLSILKRREWVQAGFTLLDHIIARTNLAKNSPLNKYARTQCVEWILRHFEQNGHIGGVWPPMHTATWALLEEGYDMKHHIISRSFTAMEDFCISDQNGKRVQPTTSPVWDTVLMQFGLCEIEMLKHDSRLCKAHDWILKMQSPANTLSGDWRIFKPKLCSGGWSFQYHNSWFPDIDDTAVAVMALIKYDVHIVKSDSIVRAITWMLGMQNPDGGWGAFDWNNNKMYLNKIPFNDMNALCDPSTADITGRLLECFGVILSSPKVELIPTSLIQKIDVATNKAIEFVLKSQELNGSWWGRWGCNYIYGSSNVMRGISHLVHNNYQLQLAASKCISWLRNCQNTCGGWGEGYESYDNPELAGKGITTASQTAWAILAMLPYCPPTDTTIRKGIEFLISSQTDFSDHGMSWPVHAMTGTGFPGTFYVGYPLYEHYFPLMALAKFVQ